MIYKHIKLDCRIDLTQIRPQICIFNIGFKKYLCVLISKSYHFTNILYLF